MTPSTPFEQLGREVIELEAETLQTLARRIDGQFAEACRLILACRGRVVVTGMGAVSALGQGVQATWEGLVAGRKMMVITSRGGQYSDPDSSAYDFQEPYLRTIMGFIGITDISFIIAQPMDLGGRETARQRLEEAVQFAKEAGAAFP